LNVTSFCFISVSHSGLVALIVESIQRRNFSLVKTISHCRTSDLKLSLRSRKLNWTILQVKKLQKSLLNWFSRWCCIHTVRQSHHLNIFHRNFEFCTILYWLTFASYYFCIDIKSKNLIGFHRISIFPYVNKTELKVYIFFCNWCSKCAISLFFPTICNFLCQEKLQNVTRKKG